MLDVPILWTVQRDRSVESGRERLLPPKLPCGLSRARLACPTTSTKGSAAIVASLRSILEVTETAEMEKISKIDVSRILRLEPPAPHLVEAILGPWAVRGDAGAADAGGVGKPAGVGNPPAA